MIQTQNTIDWSPAFYRHRLSERQLLLVGETDSYLLEGDEYRDLFSRINGETSLEDIVFRQADIAWQATLLNAIDTLHEKGFIIENDRTGSVNGYFTPDFEQEPEILRCNSDKIELRMLSRCRNADRLRQWAEQLNITEKTGIVVVDDYLDPRLDAINRSHLRKKRPWILIKPTGKRPLIGPLFSPGQKNAPCRQCLASRLHRNQPVRRWLEKRMEKPAISPPIAFDDDLVGRVLSTALPRIQHLWSSQIYNQLYSVNVENASYQTHAVDHRPQCIACGAPDMFGRQAMEPVTLASRLKAFGDDGGSRVMPPDRTLQNLEHLISPLTGVVIELGELPAGKRHGVATYRTSFYKTPSTVSNPGATDFMQVSLGKGLGREQSKVSALCETIERFAAQRQGDEPCIYKNRHELDAPSVSPDQLVFFSEKQREKNRNQPSDVDESMGAPSPNDAIHWTPCWSMTRQGRCYVPFTYCYANTPHDRGAPVQWNSNGCSAGNTLEEAMLQGFCELVERDAVAIWWYNRIARPSVCLDELKENDIRRIRQTLDSDWEYWVLDITHDFRIPVLAAVARHKKSKTFRLGFGCHPEAHVASHRALTELCQLIAIENKGVKDFDFDKIRSEPYLLPPGSGEERSLADLPGAALDDIADEIRWCMARAERLGFEVLLNNTSRPDFPIYTARVIIPGLCHIWPQFGNKRLYRTPVEMGWRESELKESQLNPMALFV